MSTSVSLPTTRDRDLGLVLLFLSAVAYFGVPTLAHGFGFSKGAAAAFSAPTGLLLMIVGIATTFFSRKTVSVNGNVVKVKDGFFARPLHMPFEETPSFKLTGFEDEAGGRADQVWTVHMVDQGRQYLIDRRKGQQTASRSLAERLAKAVQGAIIESHNGKTYTFSAEELDFSFVERVERYPEMLGQEVPEPSDKVLSFENTANGFKISWSFFRSGLLFELFCVTAFLVAAAFIPLPGGPKGHGFSLFEVELAEGDYRYFIGVGLFTVISLILLAGYRNTIELILPKRVQSRTTVWGIPVRGGRIPLEELEHVAVSITSRGPYLQLISDKKILRERMPAANIARWIGWEFRSRLAKLTPENCHVEQSVEMQSF